MKKITLIKLLLGFLAIALWLSTYAIAHAESSKFHAARYGMAGCGLGSWLSEDNGRGIQLLEVTTNHTSVESQTLGITSGTSNCTSDGTVMRDKERQAFAEVNLPDLSRDIAQGRGEYLAAFADLLGCDGKGKAALAPKAQANYGRIFPAADTTAEDVVASVETMVRTDPILSAGCMAP